MNFLLYELFYNNGSNMNFLLYELFYNN